jgi:RNA polymerase sigma-70 factor (ECF subfamily)
MYGHGQHRWPSVALDLEVFRHHCEKVLGPHPSPEAEQFGADLYLCCACAARNPEATLTFERETSRVARAAIGRVNRDQEFVEETLRELWDKLLFAHDAKVGEYSARGPLQAWTRVAAARTAIDRSRAKRAGWARQVDLSERFGGGTSGPESYLTKARYAAAFQRALQHAIGELSAQDRNLLRMHVLDRCSVGQIGRAYGVHRATAARWLERARASVLESVRKQLCRGRATLTDSELFSIAHLMGTELELTLSADPQDTTIRRGSPPAP